MFDSLVAVLEHPGVGCRAAAERAPSPAGGRWDFGQGRGWEQRFEAGGRDQTSLPSPGPTSCAFLGPEIPFQMDNSIVSGEKSPLVRIRNGAFGD